MFCHVCASNKLITGGILLQQKNYQKRLTWRPPDGTSENTIDHMAISRTQRSSQQDSRVKYNADVGSNHLLVVADVNMKLLALKKPSSTRRKYCTYRLTDQTVRERVIEVASRHDTLQNRSDDEEEVELDAKQE